MNIIELKERIKNKSVCDTLLIFKWQDCDILPQEYLNRIVEDKCLKVVYVESLLECVRNDTLFGNISSNIMFVLHCDKLTTKDYKLSEDEIKDILHSLTNTIIICKDCDTVFKDYVVEFPKLEGWQILEMMKQHCKGVGQNELKWLYDIANGNAYRLYNEVKKLDIFQKQYQEDLFNEINNEDGYSDLNNLNIFNLTNGIVTNNKGSIVEVLKNVDNIDIEGVGLITVLYKSFMNIINIQLSKTATYKDLGMTEKQFNYVKKCNCNKYSQSELMNIIDFITNFDYDLKSGNLTMNNSRMIDYIVCNILSK